MLAGRSSMTVSAYNNIAGSKEKRKALKWVTIGGSSGLSYIVSAGGSGMTNEGKGGAKLFELPGGYKQFRDIHGRQTGFVDFSFSNRMWANIKVVSTPSEHNSGIARIAATTPEDEKKLAGNTKRRGHILKLSKSEITYLSERLNMELTQVFHKKRTMNQAVASILKDYIDGLDFVDKISGLVQTVHMNVTDDKGVKVRKSYPVSCTTTAEDCKKGLYNDLGPG